MIPDPSQDALWRGADLIDDPSWRHALSTAQIDDLHRWMEEGGAFDPPSWRGLLARLRAEVEEGRGFALLRGIPVARYAVPDLERLMLGIGGRLGLCVTQTAAAEAVAHVTDKGPVEGLRRGFQTNREARFHVDLADGVALLCLRQAKSGGRSLLIGSAAVHDALRRERPDVLPILYRGFAWDRREEQGPGEAPVGPVVPVFGAHRGRFRAIYNRNFAETVHKRFGTAMTDAERIALDALDAVIARPELQLPMDFQPGDVQLVSNETVLHARTAYEDHDEPDRRRHLLRLWWNFERYADDPPIRPIPYGALGRPIAAA